MSSLICAQDGISLMFFDKKNLNGVPFIIFVQKVVRLK